MGSLDLHLSDEEVANVRRMAKDADVGSGGERYPEMMKELGLFLNTPELAKSG
jgi:hypothetical protein